jgi:hypothetical protein
MTPSALKMKLVAHRLAFVTHIMMPSAHRGAGSSKDGADSLVCDVYSGNLLFKALTS